MLIHPREYIQATFLPSELPNERYIEFCALDGMPGNFDRDRKRGHAVVHVIHIFREDANSYCPLKDEPEGIGLVRCSVLPRGHPNSIQLIVPREYGTIISLPDRNLGRQVNFVVPNDSMQNIEKAKTVVNS